MRLPTIFIVFILSAAVASAAEPSHPASQVTPGMFPEGNYVLHSGFGLYWGGSDNSYQHINEENGNLWIGKDPGAFFELAANGNVGVGSANPQAKLDVNGAVMLRPTAEPFPCASDKKGTIYFSDELSKFMMCNGAEWTEYTGPPGPAGEQGEPGLIGPAGPQGPKGDNGDSGTAIPGTAGQTLRHDGTNWVANSKIYNDGSNIGIGTTSPTRKFSVNGNADFWVGSTTSNPETVLIQGGAGYASVSAARVNSLANTDLKLGSQSAGGGVDVMTLTSGGNVGIGTTTPAAKLNVKDGSIYVDGDYAGSNRIVFRNTATTYSGDGHQWEIYPSGGAVSGSLSFFDRTRYNAGGGSTSMILYNTGGIGVSRLGLMGQYDASQVQGIWTIGAGWPISTASNTFGNQYGIGYTYQPGSGQGISGLGHQIVFTDNGVVKSAISLAGSAYFSGTVYSNGVAVCQQNGVNCQAGATNYWSPSGSNIYNNNGGNVGIGTEPGSSWKLNVAGGSYGTYSSGSSYGLYGSSSGGYGVRGDSSYMAGLFYNTVSGIVSYLDYSSYGLYTNGAGYFGGNVGIGTTSMPYSLTVNGDIGTYNQQQIHARYTTDETYKGTLSWNSLQLGNNGGNFIIAGRTAAGGALSFVVNNVNGYKYGANSPDGITAMTIASNGNVGINNPTPAAKLDVQGQTIINSYVQDAYDGWYDAIKFTNPSHAALYLPSGGIMFGMHSNRYFYWTDVTNSWYSMTLGPTGDLSVRSSVSAPSLCMGSDCHSAWPAIKVYSTSSKVTGKGNTDWSYACPAYYQAVACGIRKSEKEDNEDVVTCFYKSNSCYYSWDVDSAASSVGLDLSCTCVQNEYVSTI